MVSPRGILAVAAFAIAATGAAADERSWPVATAAERGDVETLRSLLRQGADVNAAQGDGMTALHWAAEHGDDDLTAILLYSGANVDAGTRIGRYTPLHLASRRGHASVVARLLESGADPKAATDRTGATPLHLAAASGSVATVKILLGAGAELESPAGRWAQTPLVFAASAGHADVVTALVAAGADPDRASGAVDVVEMEKADRAAEKRLSEILEGFKKEEKGGADWQPTPRQVQVAIEASRTVQRSWTPSPNRPPTGDPVASASAEAGASDVSGPVAPAKKEKTRDEKPPSYGELVGRWGGLTPLLHAVRQGHDDTVAALLDAGADVDRPSTGDGTTPLLMAALNGQFDLALTLLERGASPNRGNAAGVTPLFATLERTWAPRSSYAHPVEHQQQETTHLELLERLLAAGADPNVRLERHLWFTEYTFGVLRGAGIHLEGATPFWRAAHALDVEAMRLLKEHGADPDLPTLKPASRRRRSSGSGGVTGKVGGAFKKLAHAVGLGDPPVPVGGPALLPIHAASGAGYGQSFAGNAHRYVPGNWLPAVKFLVEECGADVNARDANGYTPLHHAASRGDNELILYLVEQGADVKATSRKGQTTADMANGPIERVPPFPETIALLTRLGAKNNDNCVSC